MTITLRSPSELREIARLIDGAYLDLVDTGVLDAWREDVLGWVEGESDEPQLSPEPKHFASDVYLRSVLVEALRLAADTIELQAILS